jgi:hypothetical protein
MIQHTSVRKGTTKVHSRWIIGLALAALELSAVCVTPAGAEETGNPDEAQKKSEVAASASRTPAQAIESGLSFLANDAVDWRAERGCATCHHGTMTVWVLSEARAQGYAVGNEVFAETMDWTKEQMVPRIPTIRDPRPGWSLVSIPAIYLAVMSQNLPVLSRDELNKFAAHLSRHQEEDGSFLLPMPAIHGAPPIWESSETLALWALLAWEPSALADPMESAAVRTSREKTIAWLSRTEPTNTTQSTALRLLLDIRIGKSAEQLQQGIDQLFKKQNADGGWSQTEELASDAYATGQTLYALSFAGMKNDRPEIQRAVALLTATQESDGSWPMSSRNHPGVETKKDPIRWPRPIKYFGSAWATLGLVRCVPSPVDTAAKRQHAFDRILGFHGKYEVDEATPERQVIGVDLRYYELSDKEVGDFTRWLQAFPRLTSLQFKSTKISDAGLAHLKSLPQLRTLTLENAAVTDSGLAPLKDLIYLEALNLKGTKVTEAGAQAIQQALPKVKVER